MSLEIIVASELADSATYICHERGSSGVVLEEAAPGLTMIRAYFPAFDWQAVFLFSADVLYHNIWYIATIMSPSKLPLFFLLLI